MQRHDHDDGARSDVVPGGRQSEPGCIRARPCRLRTCMVAALSNKANNGEVTALSSEFSRSHSRVMIGVGSQRGSWRCLVSNSGFVQEVMSAGTAEETHPGLRTGVPLFDLSQIHGAKRHRYTEEADRDRKAQGSCKGNAGAGYQVHCASLFSHDGPADSLRRPAIGPDRTLPESRSCSRRIVFCDARASHPLITHFSFGGAPSGAAVCALPCRSLALLISLENSCSASSCPPLPSPPWAPPRSCSSCRSSTISAMFDWMLVTPRDRTSSARCAGPGGTDCRRSSQRPYLRSTAALANV